MERGISCDHHGAIGIGDTEFAVRYVIDQSQGGSDIESGHLCSEELTHYLHGREVHGYFDRLSIAIKALNIGYSPNPMNSVGSHGVAHGLTRLRIDGPNVFVELIATGDDLIPIRQVFGHARQLAFGIPRVGEFSLEDPPFRLHFGGLTVCPVPCRRILRIGVDQIHEFHLVCIVGCRLDILYPGRHAELQHGRCWWGRRNDDCLNLGQRLQGSRRIISERRRRDIDWGSVNQVVICGQVINQPIVIHGRRRAVIAGTEMFPSEVHGRIGKLVAVGRGNGT